MDEGSASNQRLHKCPPSLKGWCALAWPIIRSISHKLALHHGLGPWERQDLEQELWLELLVRHGGRDRVDNYRSLGGREVRDHRDAARLLLRLELERIAAVLPQSWEFWRRLRLLPQLRPTSRITDGLIAAAARNSLRRYHLALDVAAILAELPAADRELCKALMDGERIASDDPDHARAIAALRADFSEIGLHEYL